MQNVLISLYRSILTPQYRYPDRFDQARARVTLLFSIFVVLATTVILLGSAVFAPAATPANLILINLIGLIVGVLVYFLVNSGRLRIASIVGFTLLLLPCLTLAVTTQYQLVLALPIIYGIVSFRWRGMFIALISESAALIYFNILNMAGGPISPQIIAEITSEIIILTLVAGVTLAVVIEVQGGIRSMTRLVAQLRASSEIAQTTATVSGQEDLLKRIANYIRDRFGFYQVQIFLIDKENRFANLVATTIESGEQMQQRGYRVAVGSPSVVGQVALLGSPLTMTLSNQDSTVSGTPTERPDDQIRSQVGLPLIVGDQVLGVLEVQSKLPNAFTSEETENMRLMSTHVSIAIRNVQLFDEQKAALNENRRLFLEAEVNLREMQRLNQRLTGEAWEEYLKSRIVGVIGYTITNNQLRSDSEWTPTLQQAATRRRPVISNVGDRHIVAVPVELRGKAIGAIEVETEAVMRQTETLEMLQSIAQRLALSIDNARLFEQAQELAQQELEVNTISAKLQGISGMDEIVKTTVDELSRALGANQASIRLDGTRQMNGNSNGSDNGRKGNTV